MYLPEIEYFKDKKQRDIAKGLIKPDEHDDFENLMKEAIKAMVKLILLKFTLNFSVLCNVIINSTGSRGIRNRQQRRFGSRKTRSVYRYEREKICCATIESKLSP